MVSLRIESSPSPITYIIIRNIKALIKILITLLTLTIVSNRSDCLYGKATMAPRRWRSRFGRTSTIQSNWNKDKCRTLSAVSIFRMYLAYAVHISAFDATGPQAEVISMLASFRRLFQWTINSNFCLTFRSFVHELECLPQSDQHKPQFHRHHLKEKHYEYHIQYIWLIHLLWIPYLIRFLASQLFLEYSIDHP